MATADLDLQGKLYQGEQATVFRGIWHGQTVAVKKARIGTSADMERFKNEVKLLAMHGSHSNIVPLLAARLLPPGTLN